MGHRSTVRGAYTVDTFLSHPHGAGSSPKAYFAGGTHMRPISGIQRMSSERLEDVAPGINDLAKPQGDDSAMAAALAAWSAPPHEAKLVFHLTADRRRILLAVPSSRDRDPSSGPVAEVVE
jgi:hypothetical protein